MHMHFATGSETIAFLHCSGQVLKTICTAFSTSASVKSLARGEHKLQAHGLKHPSRYWPLSPWHADDQRWIKDRDIRIKCIMKRGYLIPFSGSLMTQALVTWNRYRWWWEWLRRFQFQCHTATEPDNCFCGVQGRTAAKTETTSGRKVCICAMPFTTVWIVGRALFR